MLGLGLYGVLFCEGLGLGLGLGLEGEGEGEGWGVRMSVKGWGASGKEG